MIMTGPKAMHWRHWWVLMISRRYFGRDNSASQLPDSTLRMNLGGRHPNRGREDDPTLSAPQKAFVRGARSAWGHQIRDMLLAWSNLPRFYKLFLTFPTHTVGPCRSSNTRYVHAIFDQMRCLSLCTRTTAVKHLRIAKGRARRVSIYVDRT